MTSDRAAGLRRMLDLVSTSIDDSEPEKRAPLVNQWRALEASISELEAEAGKVGDPVDEIAARRAARGGATARARRPAGNAQ